MKVGTWSDFYASNESWDDENLASKELINLLQPLDPEDCMLNLSEFDNLAALTIDQSTDELVIVHHISKVGKSLKKSRKPEKIVALSGMGSVAHVVRFKSVEVLFSSAFITTKAIPSIEDLKNFETPSDFKNLKPEKDNKVAFRNLILLPPFVLKAILSISSKDAPNLACTISAAAQNFEDQFKNHPDFSVDDHQWATAHILGWLYCHEHKSLPALPSGFKTDEQIDFWSTNLHEKHLLSKSIPQPSGEGVPSPSDKTLSKLYVRLNDLATCMEKQHNDKEQSKDKFEQLDDHILNPSVPIQGEASIKAIKPPLRGRSIFRFVGFLFNHMCLKRQNKTEIKICT